MLAAATLAARFAQVYVRRHIWSSQGHRARDRDVWRRALSSVSVHLAAAPSRPWLHLPVQLWYLGPEDLPDHCKVLAKHLDVELVNGFLATGASDFSRLGGFECKIHAIVNCPFEQVLLIDADNIPLMDPAIIFDSEQFKRYGQVFWPDFYYKPQHRYAIRAQAWKDLGLEPCAGLELESGQLAVNRLACWEELQIVRAVNAASDQWYGRYTWGDKDTFTLAWLLTGRPYCTVPLRPQFVEREKATVLWQHWFDGRRIAGLPQG